MMQLSVHHDSAECSNVDQAGLGCTEQQEEKDSYCFKLAHLVWEKEQEVEAEQEVDVFFVLTATKKKVESERAQKEDTL